MMVTYELYAALHSGCFDEGNIADLASYPSDNGVFFDDMRVYEQTSKVLLFSFSCDIDANAADPVQDACLAARDVLYGMGYEVWEVDLQSGLANRDFGTPR